jgi:glycosyltransferase involved in cell wall biosynthesis
MPKIAIVLGDATITGAPMHVLQLSSALKQKGFEILVISPKGPIQKMFKDQQIPVKEVAMKSPYDRHSASEIRDLVSEFESDIVHFHGTRAGWLGLIGARNLKIKKIYTEHLWTKNYHLSNPAYEQFQKRGLKFLSRYADKIIAVSEAVKDFLLQNGYEKEKIILIPNGVDESYLEVNPIKKPASAPIILGAVGSLNNIKNYRMLIKAFYLVKQERPNLNIHLQIIGEGPLKRNLEGMVAHHRIINDLVSFPGRVEDIKERYQHFTIFINCSISESFGLSVGEAMAVGLPVIASKIPALQELVGDSGLFIDAHDRESIKKAILKLIDDDKLRLELGQKAKRRIEKQFSESVMINKTIKLYEDLIKK